MPMDSGGLIALHTFHFHHSFHIALLRPIYSMAAYEATEWARTQKEKQQQQQNGGKSGSYGGGGAGGAAAQAESSNYNLFRLAARNMENSYTHSMDIQEKYNIK